MCVLKRVCERRRGRNVGWDLCVCAKVIGGSPMDEWEAAHTKFGEGKKGAEIKIWVNSV